jgi:hypothetical protein
MLPVNYKPPELMPPHQRDFPRRYEAPELQGQEDGRALGLMVVSYLTVVFAGIVLLGTLAAPVPQASTVAISTEVAQ